MEEIAFCDQVRESRAGSLGPGSASGYALSVLAKPFLVKMFFGQPKKNFGVFAKNCLPGGRPPGPTMPCGWGCGAALTASQIRPHFTGCPMRPQKTSITITSSGANSGEITSPPEIT